MQTNTFYSEIGKECDSEWKIIEYENKLLFSYPKYGKQRFEVGVIQIYDDVKKQNKKNLYPIIDVQDDPLCVGFNINTRGGTAKLIPNKFETEVRRSKKIEKYMRYRKEREQNEREYKKDYKKEIKRN
tara:strand:+ start:67 stop:450 length:384 start_codon:yes stop_codon:yes gene_type:complete